MVSLSVNVTPLGPQYLLEQQESPLQVSPNSPHYDSEYQSVRDATAPHSLKTHLLNEVSFRGELGYVPKGQARNRLARR